MKERGTAGTSTNTGRAGERRAAQYLEKNGYQILERNFRTGRGEVDIIAIQQDTLVFCEVKTWRSIPVEELADAITARKAQRIFDASLHFLEEHPKHRGLRLRFDVIHIAGEPESGTLRHLESAIERP